MARQETATLGGGCFWCLEAVYQDMEGVQSVESGYMGGAADTANYEAVCTRDTGHVEVVRLTFDPDVTTFEEILQVFFTIHDPTTLNRQENDVGPQYRSVIFYHSEEQKTGAKTVIRELEEAQLWSGPVVTTVEPASTFYPAENYHQNYFKTHMSQAYCIFLIAPKVAKFRKWFPNKVRPAE